MNTYLDGVRRKLKILFSLVSFACLLFLLASCKQRTEEEMSSDSSEAKNKIDAEKKSDVFYHYSIWHAFVNKVFEGDITAAEIKANGDLGLGSYNLLDGELIMLNGKLYQAKEDGTVVIPAEATKVVYANATFFDTNDSFELGKVANYENLRDHINKKLPTKNMFYAFKIHGEFTKMKCGGLHKQQKPFKDGLDVLIPNRPIFERENFSGTMVGFFCPEFIGDINASGYHLHFVSDDETFAGHVMEFEAKNLSVEIDQIHEYKFVLPQTEAYAKVGFDKEFQYKKQ